ncbi:MAG: hypothetical protein JW395_1053 [Nitrospira sp.]|nr:hypothetical protein [Nitrospira sp.]
MNGWTCHHQPARCGTWEWGKFISLHTKQGYIAGWESRPLDMPPD